MFAHCYHVVRHFRDIGTNGELKTVNNIYELAFIIKHTSLNLSVVHGMYGLVV